MWEQMALNYIASHCFMPFWAQTVIDFLFEGEAEAFTTDP